MRFFLCIAFAFIAVFSVRTVHAQPTWAEDVARIVYAKCTPCHRAGEIAPFTLENYSDASAARYAMKSMVNANEMPPWPPAKGHGDFLGDRSLSATDKQTIIDWVDANAPLGDPQREPPPPTFPSGSQLGTPDLVLTMSEEWSVKGNYKDVYRFFVLPSGLIDDKDVAAIEFRPGNAKVVHHVLFFVDTTGRARELDAADPLPGYSGFGDPGFQTAGSYLGWVPGAPQRFFPEGVGVRLYKNCDLVIQVHYAPSSSEEIDRSHLNIFYQKNNDVRLIQQFALSPNNLSSGIFYIPANTTREFKTSYKIPLEVSLVAVAPHMHLLGRTGRAYAVTPSNDTIDLILINDWDFHWQGGYTYRHPIRVPRNSTLHYDATYDNTPNNPENPNKPPKGVGWGESTTDEMLLCYFFWLPYQPGDEVMNMETTSLGFRLQASGVRPKASSLTLNVNPTPVVDHAQVVVNSVIEGDATIQVFDATGQNILQINDIHLHEGSNSVSLKLEAYSLKPDAYSLTPKAYCLAPGMYTVVVNAHGATANATMIVVR